MSLIGTMGRADVEPKYMYLARVLSDMGLVCYAPEIPSTTLSPRGREFYKAGGFPTVAKTCKKTYWFNIRVVGTRDLIVALASATLSALISIALSLHFVARSQYKESQSVNQVQNSQQLEQSYLKILIQFISTHNV